MKKITLISCFLLLIIFQCKKDKLIISNPAYGIGTIIFYKPANKTSSRIDFVYYINGKTLENNYQNNDNGWSVPFSLSCNPGDKYMVQYDPSNPNTCRFLFDYPIHDSTDYLNDANQFKTHPPSCCLIYAIR
jgi:hypothetical protein